MYVNEPEDGRTWVTGIDFPQDLKLFASKHPGLPVKGLALQDLEAHIEIVAGSLPDESIIAMKHDFFTEQPVKG